jgi:hypothetical protein
VRTTITLDADVEALVKQAMRESDASFKQVLNDALRRGLQGDAVASRLPFVQRVHDCGRPLVDLTKAGALAAELEDQELIAKLAQGR